MLLCGGSRSGKSALAERCALYLAGRARPAYYIATMRPADAEDRARIARHRQSRAGLPFETIECPGLLAELPIQPGAVYLVDSLTAWWMNALFPDPLVYAPDTQALARARGDLVQWLGGVSHAVLVCDMLFCDAGDFDPVTQLYCQGLGELCCQAAAYCDVVCEMSAGLPLVYKGHLPWEN